MEDFDQVLDSPNLEQRSLRYAGFWIRVVAWILDGVLLAVAGYIVEIFFGSMDGIYSLLPLALNVAYFALMESSTNQATLGKMAVGIKVGNPQGDPISFVNATGRFFAKFISAMILLIGFLMVAWDDRNQGLHDKMADTVVFYSN